MRSEQGAVLPYRQKTADSGNIQVINLLVAVQQYTDDPCREKNFQNLKRAQRHAEKYMEDHLK